MELRVLITENSLVFDLKYRFIIEKALSGLTIDDSMMESGFIEITEDKCLRYNLLHKLTQLSEVECIKLY